jgi:hypothetical protein
MKGTLPQWIAAAAACAAAVALTIHLSAIRDLVERTKTVAEANFRLACQAAEMERMAATFTVDEGRNVVIPAGTTVQSLPPSEPCFGRVLRMVISETEDGR